MTTRLPVYLLATLFIGAGLAHFAWPAGYVRIVPRWVPDAEAAVLWSGVAEILLGGAILLKRTRHAAAIGIVMLLIVVFPANVQMAKDWMQKGSSTSWLAIARLPLQALLILWAWKVRKA
jgi:uncharacterized membrane protein